MAVAAAATHTSGHGIPGNQQLAESSTESANVPSNTPSVQCLLRTAVNVGNEGAPDYIHANKIAIERPPAANSAPVTGATTISYIAGQSPQPSTTHFASDATRLSLTGTGAPQKTEEWQKFLLAGIQSGQGIFQFVSERAHRWSIADDAKLKEFEQKGTPRSRETPFIDQFMEAIKKSPDRAIRLGNHTISYIETESEQTETHKRIMLSVTDKTGTETTIPLTQVGLKFAGKVLQTEQIVEAKKQYDAHIGKIDRKSVNASAPTMVLSYAGIGRSATLIVYNEITERIKSGALKSADEIIAAMDAVIDQGRNDRGRGFVHSPEQRNALLESLKTFLKNNPPAQVQTPIPPSPLDQNPPPAEQQQQSGSAGDGATLINGAVADSNAGVSNSAPKREIATLAELLNHSVADALLKSYLKTDKTKSTLEVPKYCGELSLIADGQALTINGKSPSFVHILLAQGASDNNIYQWFGRHSNYVCREFLIRSITEQLDKPNEIDTELARQWDFIDYDRKCATGIEQLSSLVKKLFGNSRPKDDEIENSVNGLMQRFDDNASLLKSIKHHLVLPKQWEYLNRTVGGDSFNTMLNKQLQKDSHIPARVYPEPVTNSFFRTLSDEERKAIRTAGPLSLRNMVRNKQTHGEFGANAINDLLQQSNYFTADGLLKVQLYLYETGQLEIPTASTTAANKEFSRLFSIAKRQAPNTYSYLKDLRNASSSAEKASAWMKTHAIDSHTIVTTLNSIMNFGGTATSALKRSAYWQTVPTQFKRLDLTHTSVQTLNLDEINMFIAEVRKAGNTQSTYQTYIKDADSQWLQFDPEANKGIKGGVKETRRKGIAEHSDTAALITSLQASDTISLIVDANKITNITNATA